MESVEKLREEQLNKKTRIAKRLDEIDVRNLSPEDEKFLYDTVQNYFIDNFPVDKEMVKQIPEKILLMDDEDAFSERRGRDDPDYEKKNMPKGFYDLESDEMIINASGHDDAVDLFSTIFHESLHFMSIRCGAGFGVENSGIKIPEELDIPECTEEDFKHYMKLASNVLPEGTTKLIELESLESMGLDIEKNVGYMPQRQIMNSILSYIVPDYDQFLEIYFNKSVEDMRKKIECTLLPEDKKEEFKDGDMPTGEFTKILLNIGRAVEKMEKSYEINDRETYFGVLDDVRAAARYYMNLLKEKQNV